MLQFLLFYSIILILSSIFINGWFAITRGRWEYPEGYNADDPNSPKRMWKGKIFRFWHRWFLKAPEIIADPLALCITCFASVYGTIMWVFWYQLSKEFNQAYPTEVITAFLALSLKLKIALWVVFCMSLAYINELLNKLKG